MTFAESNFGGSSFSDHANNDASILQAVHDDEMNLYELIEEGVTFIVAIAYKM